jgi:hypothetical protein
METSRGTDSGTAYCATVFQTYYACINNNHNNNANNNNVELERRSCQTETLEARACGCVASLSARIACDQSLDQARQQLPNIQAFEKHLLDKCRNCMRTVMAGKSVPEPIIPNTSSHNVERALKRFMETGTSDAIPSLLLGESSSNDETGGNETRNKMSFWQKWLSSGK